MTRIEDSTFTCSLCLEIFCEPMECENCHNNFCKKCCSKLKKCPLCIKEPFKIRENISLKRILMDMKFICPNNCGGSFSKCDLNAHLKECKKPLVYCSICPFKGSKEKFWLHIIENHKEEIISLIMKQNTTEMNNNTAYTLQSSETANSALKHNMSMRPMHNPQSFENSQIYQSNSILSQRQNSSNIDPYPGDDSEGRIMGSNGIYYCHQQTNLNCGCCNGVCAQGNCLCKVCMNLNTKLQKLKQGDLINKAGKASRYSMSSYYCGEKYIDIKKNVVGFVFQQEVSCNYPNNPCPNCKQLPSLINKYI